MKTRRVFSAPDIDTAEAALHVALHMGIQPDHAALVGHRPQLGKAAPDHRAARP